MFPRSFNTLLLLMLTLMMTAFSHQEGSGSGERLATATAAAAAAAALSTIGGVLPTSISSTSSSSSSSSFVTAIIRQTTGIQTTEEVLASSSSSSLPTIASVPPDYPPSSSSHLVALSSPSLRRSVNNNNNIDDEKSPTSPTTQEVPSLPKRWYRARMPGIWAQCDSYYSLAMWVYRIDQIKEWHVPDDQIETNMRTELKRLCGGGTTGWNYGPPSDDGMGAHMRFLTSLFIHHDCVEKAIIASGGPPIKCRSGKPRPWQGPAAPFIPVIDGPVRIITTTTTTTPSSSSSSTSSSSTGTSTSSFFATATVPSETM